MSTAAFLLVAWFLASRHLSTAPDDIANLQYFEGARRIDPNSTWLEYFVEEPLWAIWTTMSGYALGAESAMRLTIFTSSFGFLWGATRLSKKSWIFILLVFVLSESLATQLYYNQIRQGVGLTLFLVGLASAKRWRPVVTGIAAAIHSSFAFSFLALQLALFVRNAKPQRIVAVSLVVVLGTAALFAFVDKSYLIDSLGRRGQAYGFDRPVNFQFYLVSVACFAAVMFGTRRLLEDEISRPLWQLTWYFYCMAFVLSFYHEASGRLFYSLGILYPILIARRFARMSLPHVLFLSFVVASSVWSHMRDYDSSVFQRWGLILFGNT